MVVLILLWPACQSSSKFVTQNEGQSRRLWRQETWCTMEIMLVARWRSCWMHDGDHAGAQRWRSKRKKRTISYHIILTACDVNPFMHLMIACTSYDGSIIG